jgi:hypothetical protein
MRGWITLAVLDGVTGEIAGNIRPRKGMKTSLGTILRFSDGGTFTFQDEGGVVARHRQAEPFVEEDEARKWGYACAHPLTSAMAV